MTRVFVTGASGNVGRCALAELVHRDHEVVALVRNVVPGVEGVRPVFGSLSTIHAIASEVARAEAIIHAASPRTDDRKSAMAEDVAGTGWLIDAWSGGTFVFTSSQTIYGIPSGPLTEDSPTSAESWYDLAKICNEAQLAIAVRERGGGVGVSLRLPLLFASGPRRRDRQFLPPVVNALSRGEKFFFRSEQALEESGSVYIGEEDLGRAIADSLTIAKAGPYNLCGGFCTWRELLETLGRHTGRAPRLAIHPEPALSGEYRLPQSRSFFNTSKFSRATKFLPRQSLDEVIARFVRAEGLSSL